MKYLRTNSVGYCVGLSWSARNNNILQHRLKRQVDIWVGHFYFSIEHWATVKGTRVSIVLFSLWGWCSIIIFSQQRNIPKRKKSSVMIPIQSGVQRIIAKSLKTVSSWALKWMELSEHRIQCRLLAYTINRYSICFVHLNIERRFRRSLQINTSSNF